MVCLLSHVRRLSLVAALLLLGTLVACGGGGSGISLGTSGDVGGGAAATPVDTGSDDSSGDDSSELAPTGGGGTPVAVEIPALGDVNNLPFISGVVVYSGSSSLSAQLSTSKSFTPSKSLLPQAAVAPANGGILLSGTEDFDADDSMTACATAQQWQDIWKKNAQTNDLALCKIKATVALAEANAVDPYDGSYHIFEDASTKTRFRVVRNSSDVIESLEYFTCNTTGLAGPTQSSYSLYSISNQAITISTKYYEQVAEAAALPIQASLRNTGNIATLTGTLYEEDPTQYTAKNLTNLKTYDVWRDNGSGVYSVETANNTISSLVQEPARVLIDSGSSSYTTVGGITNTSSGLYSSADIQNPDDATFVPANYRMFKGAGTLTDSDLIKAYYGYAANYIAEPNSLTECWNNSLMTIECLDSNTNYLAISGHTPRDPSELTTASFSVSETWDCSGTADIPDDDDLYTSCTDAMYSSFVGSGFGCQEKLEGHAVDALLLEANGSGYSAGEAPIINMRLSYGADDAVFGFSDDYIPDPINEFTACAADDCAATSIGFKTAQGPAFSLGIVTQPTGKVCQVSTGNGLYYGPGNASNDITANSTYIRCIDCPGGVCPSVSAGVGKTPTKMVMFSSDYGIDGFIGFGATDVRTRADNICRYSSQLPDGCGTPHAFISVSASDDIASMPTNFGFSNTLQVASTTNIEIAQNWSRIAGGLGVAILTNTLADAGVTTNAWWSGSDINAAIGANSCSGWTSRSAMGSVGASDSIGIFVAGEATSCDKAMHENYKLLCLCPRLPYTVFVTGVTWSPSGGVTGADTFCNNNKPEGVSGTYKAMLANGSTRVACTTANCSGSNENVDWVFRPNTQYQRADGTVIGTTTSKGIFSFPLGNAISSTVLDLAWTGIDSNWTSYSDTCNAWTDSSNGYFGLVGNANSTVTDGGGLDKALAATLFQCNSSRNLICVEQP